MGKPAKVEVFKQNTKKDFLGNNTIEVNVWFPYNYSNQYSSIDLFRFRTCDKELLRMFSRQAFIFCSDNRVYDKNRQVEKRCIVEATNCLRKTINWHLFP